MARILIIEPSHEPRDAVGDRLLSQGHEIFSAQDEKVGVVLLKNVRPDYILMDFRPVESIRQILQNAIDRYAPGAGILSLSQAGQIPDAPPSRPHSSSFNNML